MPFFKKRSDEIALKKNKDFPQFLRKIFLNFSNNVFNSEVGSSAVQYVIDCNHIYFLLILSLILDHSMRAVYIDQCTLLCLTVL